jgi:hypothetical protein
MDDRIGAFRHAREIRLPSTFRFPGLSVSNGSSIFILISLKAPDVHIARPMPRGTNAISDFRIGVLREFYSEAGGLAEICEAAARSELCRWFDT